VWAYLTDSELRRKWLASGSMDLRQGAAFELVWRNDELTDPPGEKPADFGTEHRMASHILSVEAPHRLTFTWGEKETGEVTFELSPVGEEVRLTVIHRRIPDKKVVLRIGPGWHAHLDILAAKLSGLVPTPFWDHWKGLQAEYERRLTTAS
jgi:uncharacterized protein YndB with AHSA1/START domain